MKIGIIGTGSIGAELTRKLSAAGHAVQVANTRGPQSTAQLAAEAGATPVTLDEVGAGVDVLVTSIPFARMPDIKPIVDRLPSSVPVADTSNYYRHRDGRIEEIDNGTAEGMWVEQQLDRPVVRAWNSVVQSTLQTKARPKGAPDRIAVPVAGGGWLAKRLVMGLVDDTGFDPVDAGDVEDTWRIQMAAPAYCTDLNAEQLEKALGLADRDAVLARREAVLSIIESWDHGESFFDDLVALNRAAAGLSRLLGR
ncbi:NADPH-dependent F420 reductase [Pseudonocardia zijingensis]|uniref:NAD(P)-binding domain-containing protein n=1 Tax=Pseudonocardia zijingensis TaxID=153376 RepID=A0ABP3YJ21_9PSEU